MLTKDDKKEMVGLIADAINDVIVPALEKTETRLKEDLASKEDIKDLGLKIDSLERKFNAQQNRQDRYDVTIEKLEKIHPQSKHLATI